MLPQRIPFRACHQTTPRTIWTMAPGLKRNMISLFNLRIPKERVSGHQGEGHKPFCNLHISPTFSTCFLPGNFSHAHGPGIRHCAMHLLHAASHTSHELSCVFVRLYLKQRENYTFKLTTDRKGKKKGWCLGEEQWDCWKKKNIPVTASSQNVPTSTMILFSVDPFGCVISSHSCLPYSLQVPL